MPEENFDKQEEWEQEENRGKNPEELKSEKKESIEKAFIPLPVIIMLTLIAAQSDGFEFFGFIANAIPLVGQAIWFITLIDGIFSSATIAGYLIFKTASDLGQGTNVGILTKQIIKRRVAPAIAGFLADSLTGGVLPIRTVTFLLIAYLNNHNCRKQLDKLEEK